MVISWFDTKDVESFAVLLASDFCQRIPLSSVKEIEGKKKQKFNDAIRVINDRIDKFIADKSINFFKRSCFGNKLRWILKGAKYPDDLINLVVFNIIERVSSRGF